MLNTKKSENKDVNCAALTNTIKNKNIAVSKSRSAEKPNKAGYILADKAGRKIAIGISAFLLCAAFVSTDGRKLPAVDLKTLDGKTISTSKFSNNGKPMIIDFWATWCTPCKKELSAISDVYDDWQKETGVKLIAISIDDSKTSSKVKSTVDAKGWDYEVYIDVNSDFKRAMGVNNVPYLCIIDGKGNIVWENNTYVEGGENKIHEILLKVSKGEKIEK